MYGRTRQEGRISSQRLQGLLGGNPEKTVEFLAILSAERNDADSRNRGQLADDAEIVGNHRQRPDVVDRSGVEP